MFLKYLSEHEVEEKYWPFVFRLETVISGVVKASSGRLAAGTPEERLTFLFDALGATLDRRGSPLPEGWWPDPVPPIEWFDDYIHREFDAITAEAARRSLAEKNGGKSASAEEDDPFDRVKVRECAHRSDSFRAFLLPESKEDGIRPSEA